MMARLPGSVRKPPLPQFTVLRDRGDDHLWVLSFAIANSLLHISINDEGLDRGILPDRQDLYSYEGDGYGVGMGKGIRLFVRNGRLGYEVAGFDTNSSPPWARKGVQREAHQVIVPSTYKHFGDMLGWIEENVFA